MRPFLVLAIVVAACTPAVHVPAPSLHPAPPIPADSAFTTGVAPGVVHHSLYRSAGPWAIHVLDVDRNACWSPAVLKRDPVAVGREKTSALLALGRSAGDTVAAVNADFFLFAPPGVPTGTHVDDGALISGPMPRRPVLAVDSAGRLQLTRFRVEGFVVARGDSIAITEWNHLPLTRLGAFDERWGPRTDSSSATLQVVVGSDGRVVRTVRARTGTDVPRGGWVLAARDSAPARVLQWLGTLAPGDDLRIRTALAPFHPREAVGGHPMLVVDSALAPVLDSANVQGLGAVRHPRTAVGIARDGRRLILVVVDGRQPGYSAGMTLPELARLMLELGAHDAMNLDGGGSSAMVARRAAGDVQVINRPSDAAGERPVANALAVVRGCMP